MVLLAENISKEDNLFPPEEERKEVCLLLSGTSSGISFPSVSGKCEHMIAETIERIPKRKGLRGT